MVAPAVTHRESLCSDLQRAIERAAAERIVIFRKTAGTLGVATITAGQWTVKPYVLTITGEGAGELTCSCPAGINGRCCKHVASGIMARKYHVYAKAPQMARIESAGNPLEVLFS